MEDRFACDDIVSRHRMTTKVSTEKKYCSVYVLRMFVFMCSSLALLENENNEI